MNKVAVGVFGLVMLAGLGGPAIADEPSRSAPPARPGMMMRDAAPGGGMMRQDGASGRHHHRRSCFDAAWQSEAWKRCEAMMESRKRQG